MAAISARDRQDLWRCAVRAARALGGARPSMGTAIMACLARAFEEVGRVWDGVEAEEKGKGKIVNVKKLAEIGAAVIEKIIAQRKNEVEMLGMVFVGWVEGFLLETTTLTILTPSTPTPIHHLILVLLTHLPTLTLTLLIHEPRPGHEAAATTSQLVSSIPVHQTPRLTIEIIPNCAVATAARRADVVVLSAERIEGNGDVKGGSGLLGVVGVGKSRSSNSPFSDINTRRRGCRVVVLTDIDRIAPSYLLPSLLDFPTPTPNTRHTLKSSSAIAVFDEWFETVPARFVDAYVTEKGVLDLEGVRGVSVGVGELRESIFGGEL
ncbi:hypothetical protein P280DRAFT_511189 [Massarina eburnea CBS 473.64]|uniref:Nagb/rpia/CoA transferase-like protein n=1 Tax=Massarina eburnea CBS 473.64 TaxID=1395130 RepID=A0A6A6RJD4_9PLEO|nr:hypothetical protein P280DRAFT_511189 [Massarina eburnea CBS 473.64]